MTQQIPIYAALFLAGNEFFKINYVDVINLLYRMYPNSQLFFDIYLTSPSTPEKTIQYLNEYLLKYPIERKAIITPNTSEVVLINKYLNEIKLEIPIFSPYATSPIVRTLNNVLTYAPSDKYSVMSLFMKFVDYQMESITILRPKVVSPTGFTQTYINETKKQANFLGISVNEEIIEIGKVDYGIKPKTMIIIILATTILYNFINQEFLDLIPKSCFIALTDANVSVGDIFGYVPTFVMLPYPFDYTQTSQMVADSLTFKQDFNYSYLTFFDIIFSLNFYTGVLEELTIENFIKVNPFQETSPAFISFQSILNPEINGYDFGLYQSVFTKNVLIEEDKLLFNLVNQGGTNFLPESKSVFKTVGIVPYVVTQTFYGDEDYYKIYDECGNLIVVRFASNKTKNIFDINTNYGIGQVQQSKFIYKYNEFGYFSFLQKIFNPFGDDSIVNKTMGKKPIYKKFISNT